MQAEGGAAGDGDAAAEVVGGLAGRPHDDELGRRRPAGHERRRGLEPHPGRRRHDRERCHSSVTLPQKNAGPGGRGGQKRSPPRGGRHGGVTWSPSRDQQPASRRRTRRILQCPTPPPTRRRVVTGRAPDWWASLNDEQLLDVRMCDLGVTIEGSKLVASIAQLHAELENRNLAFEPHYWLSDEWFTPDGVGGIAIPFYLAHPAARAARGAPDARGGGRHARLVRARSCATRPGTPSTTPTSCSAAASGSSCSGRRRPSIPSTTRRSRTARASSCTSIPGTRRAIPTRTSPRRSRCGSTRTRSGASATPTGRR